MQVEHMTLNRQLSRLFGHFALFHRHVWSDERKKTSTAMERGLQKLAIRPDVQVSRV